MEYIPPFEDYMIKLTADASNGKTASNPTNGLEFDGKTTQPHRVQLSRKKGWRMPPNTVSVARPGKWGNPFKVSECREAGFVGSDEDIAARCVEAFRVWIDTPYWRTNWQGEESEKARSALLSGLTDLRGKNLACWCTLDAPCHADVLLEIANRTPEPRP
jgi:hypothetical protein